MSRSRISVAALLVVTVVAAGCSDSGQPTVPSDEPEDPSLRVAAQGRPDDPHALARGVRGFGGFFLDAQGTPTVYLKESGQRAQAEQALAPWLRAHGFGPSVRVQRGQFDWTELERWQEQVGAEALAVPGAVFVDADEAANRVRVGAEAGAMGQVRSAVARLKLPADAVIIEEAAPVELAATLRDQVRPVVGGLQINFPGFLCTLGFNARDGNQDSFITNSHCTTTQGGVENTPYYQPLQSTSPLQIATEVEDPAYQRNLPGCPRGKLCRRSDAARARHINSTSFTLGGIAKTTGANNGSLEISGGFTINGEGVAAVGQVVNKIGRTTGWTRGTVTNTCVTTNVSGSRITQICQTFVSAGVGSGDSGSPVFFGATTGGSATLLGILWGGSGSSTFVYSPIGNVEGELGSLTTFTF
jgi:hypothetical protein